MFREIEQCRGCQSKDLRSALDLGQQYIVNFVDDPKTPADKSPIHLVYCNNCRLVQLKHSVDPERLFRKFWYYSSVNTTMKKHLYDLTVQTREIERVNAGDWVIDIGANDGELLGNYPRNINTLGIEPARNVIPLLKKNCSFTLNDFFGENIRLWCKERAVKAKHIYAIAMFYDIEDPLTFCENVKEILADTGIFVIQMNYLKSMLQNVAVDNILHEHLCYYSIQTLEPILEKAGLKIFHVSENDLNGGSIRLYICHDEDDKRITYFNYAQAVADEQKYFGPAYASKLKKRLDDFAERVTHAKKVLSEFVHQEHDKHKTIYAYGASTRGSALLQTMGLKYPQVTLAVERNQIKFDKWMSGLGIRIISEDEMREMPPDFLLILPYFFFEEFKDRESGFLANGGRFIIPTPSGPFVYDGDGKTRLLS